jgi:hypothetical protein
MCHINAEDGFPSADSAATQQFPDIVHCKGAEADKYSDEKLHNCVGQHCTTNCFQRNR